jgi:predicted transcriptional regulator
MKNVLSVRLDEAAMERIRELASRQEKELSTVARELIEQGWILVTLKEYRDGKLSLGNLAERLDVSVAQALDLLAELGVRSPVTYDDYLEGYRVSHSLVADKDDQ